MLNGDFNARSNRRYVCMYVVAEVRKEGSR